MTIGGAGLLERLVPDIGTIAISNAHFDTGKMVRSCSVETAVSPSAILCCEPKSAPPANKTFLAVDLAGRQPAQKRVNRS